MKNFILTISSFLIVALASCNTEDEVGLVGQNSYIKIIQGLGTDAPLSVEEFNGELLIVSNSTIRGANSTSSNKVRVLRVNLNGDVLREQSFPRNSDQNWQARDIVLMDNDRILVGGTVGANDSLFFLEINAQIDSVTSQYYSSDLEKYQLTGLSYDESSSKIFFGGSAVGNDEYILFGQMNGEDLSIDQIYKSNKTEALPSTAILEDETGGLIWAYNSDSPLLVRSNDRYMRQLDESDKLDFKNASSIVTKKLVKSAEGEITLFGELISEGQRNLFFYKPYSGIDPIYFGESGQNQLNGVKQIDGGYLVTGSTEVAGDGGGVQQDFYLSRRGINGGESFSDSFGSDADEELHDAVMVNDNIYSIGSTVIGIENTLLLIKTDKIGRLVN